jgi:hypothetical protein
MKYDRNFVKQVIYLFIRALIVALLVSLLIRIAAGESNQSQQKLFYGAETIWPHQ